MSKWRVISDRAIERLAIGEVKDVRTHPMVTDKVLREYALALRDPNPLWHDKGYAEREGRFARRVAPSAFCLTLNPMERVGLKPASDFWEEIFGEPGDYWGGHAAYNRFELARPIYVGDTITTEVSNRDCYEKEGKRALLVVAESQYRMTNQDGEYVGLGIYGNMVQRPYPDA